MVAGKSHSLCDNSINLLHHVTIWFSEWRHFCACKEEPQRPIWYSNSKYRRTPHLYEDNLKQHFVSALSQLLTDRTAMLDDGRLLLRELLDVPQIEEEPQKIQRN